MGDWNATQYLKFESERTRPSQDLIGRLADCHPDRVLDLGCGPGNSTRQLAARFPQADLLGVDASEEMLRRAREQYPQLAFQRCLAPQELDRLEGGFDLIFSNACLQWIPNQTALLEALFAKLNPGGVLAVQIPLVQRAPFYRRLNRLITTERWSRLSSVQCFYNEEPGVYADWLLSHGYRFSMWETTYYHWVDSVDGVLEWYRGSGLRPYLDALGEAERAAFLADLRAEVADAYPVRQTGCVQLTMPRFFFTAEK